MSYSQPGLRSLAHTKRLGQNYHPNSVRNRFPELSVPCLKTEQQKIVAVMYKIQLAIEIEEELIATARELHQTAIRQLFKCGLHGETQKEADLGPMQEDWDVVPLGTLERIGTAQCLSIVLLKRAISGLTGTKVYDITITKADQLVSPMAAQ